MTDTRRRVKLYELNAERQWDDKGTGDHFAKILEFTEYIFSHYFEGVLSGARSMVTEPLFKTPLGTRK